MAVTESMSRRRFVQSAGAVAGSSLLRISATSLAAITEAASTAHAAGAAFATLGEKEAADFAAIAARIIPTTDTPGAAEAGVIHFFDRAWGDELASSLEDARGFLQTLNAAADARFATLSPDAQDKLLQDHEDDGRFQLLRVMTIFGFFAMSKHGGNQNHVSWDLIGFRGHQGAWASPFGYYDAQYLKEHGDGE